jgi:hypothetical protein
VQRGVVPETARSSGYRKQNNKRHGRQPCGRHWAEYSWTNLKSTGIQGEGMAPQQSGLDRTTFAILEDKRVPVRGALCPDWMKSLASLAVSPALTAACIAFAALPVRAAIPTVPSSAASASAPALPTSATHHMGVVRPPGMDDDRWKSFLSHPKAHLTRVNPRDWHGGRPKSLEDEDRERAASANDSAVR